jgi:hypothetical protein
MNRTLLAATFLAASTGLAAAHDTTPIERELSRQARLIEDGRRSGELTIPEVRMLESQQSRIVWMLRAARYDGNVTKREFNAICDEQEAAGRSIVAESTDADVSRWRRYRADRDDWDRDYDRGYDRGWGRGWGGYGSWGYGRWGYGYGPGYGRGDRDTY